MKAYLLTCILCMLLLPAFAQDKNVPSPVPSLKDTTCTQQDTVQAMRVIVSVGAAIPYGNFNAETAENYTPYFAKTGSTLAISLARDFHKHMAFGFTLGLRANAVDIEAYMRTAKLYSPIEKFTSGTWYSGFFMADLYMQIPANRVVYYSKLSSGVSYTTHPDHTFEYGSASDRNYRVMADPAIAFAYSYAGGARYDLGRWSIGIEAGFFAVTPTFDLKSDNPTREPVKVEKDMHTFNTSLYLSYRLK